MNKAQTESVNTILKASKNIIIVAHKNPDGDAIGSSLGLYYFLINRGYNVSVVMPNDFPDFLKWLPGTSQINNLEQHPKQVEKMIIKADLIFTLDFNHFSRTGDLAPLLTQTKANFILIDHHQEPDNFAIVTYSDTKMSSTCQMVYHFIEKLKGKNEITQQIATCLYTGIVTDTGSFKFSSTTSITHKVAAHLLKCGAPATKIHQNIYDTNTPERLQLLGIALNNLKTIPQYRCAYITLSQKELDKCNFKKGDTEGFVNYALSLNNIELAVIFIENKQESIIKISFRSKDQFSVNDFARTHFQGGGHHNAAGGRSFLGLKATVNKFISILPQYKTKLNY